VASGQADKERVRLRVEAVYRLLLQGDSLSNICENSRKTWGVSASQVYRYAQRARTLIKKEADRVREEAFAEHVMARRRMRKEAHDAADKRLAFDILKDESKLLDLYPAAKQDITSGGEKLIIEVVREAPSLPSPTP